MSDNLTPYDLDMLRSAAEMTTKEPLNLQGIATSVARLNALGFLAPTSNAVGAGYIITDAGLARLAELEQPKETT